MIHHESVAYYAEGETVYLPQTNYQKMLGYAHKHNVDYLVAWHGELTTNPELSSLLDEKFEHPELKTVYVSKEPGDKIVIYKFLPVGNQ